MFGINKVTGRGRQTIEALKNSQGGASSNSGVLNNQRNDVAELVLNDNGNANHKHTFRLGNSNSAFISCESSSTVVAAMEVIIKIGDVELCHCESCNENKFSYGVSIINGFICPIAVDSAHIYNGDPFDAVKKIDGVPLFSGDGTLGNISVECICDGNPSDKTPFTSSITVNFN